MAVGPAGAGVIDLSIVAACYREQATVAKLHERLCAALQGQHRSYEIIFVNDGSGDGTLEELLRIARGDPRVVVVDLEANYGQWQALTAGICVARGAAIAFLDCDLQVDPMDITPLLDRFDEGYDVVGGRRVNRQDTLFRKAVSRLGNRVFRNVTKGAMNDIGCSMKVFRADLLRAFEFGPMTPFRPLQVLISANKIAEMPISHHPRRHGESKWGLGTLVSTFSFAMLDLLQGRIRQVGLLCWLVAGIPAAIAVGGLIAGKSRPWIFVAAASTATLLQAGLVLIVIDLAVLTLVARRARPTYLVRRVFRFPAAGDPA